MLRLQWRQGPDPPPDQDFVPIFNKGGGKNPNLPYVFKMNLALVQRARLENKRHLIPPVWADVPQTSFPPPDTRLLLSVTFVRDLTESSLHDPFSSWPDRSVEGYTVITGLVANAVWIPVPLANENPPATHTQIPFP